MKEAVRSKVAETVIVATIMLTMTGATTCFAEESAPAAMTESPYSADLSIGVYSQYIWRGFELSKDSAVIQPSMTIAYDGFAFNLWGNLDTDQEGLDEGNWNETDMTLSYDGSAGMVGYGVGLIYYALDGADDTMELYGSVSLSTILSPTLAIYRDFDNYPGWYATLGVSHSFSFTDEIALDLGAQVGYLDDDNDYSEFHDGQLSASISIPLTENVTLTPELYYSFALSSEAEDLIESASFDGDDSSFIYGGISLSFAF